MARSIIYMGLVLVVIGLALRYAPWAMKWFGNLPGDIRFKSGNGHVYIPVTSMIVVSIVLTIAINLFRR